MSNAANSERFLQPEADGLPTRPSGAWVKEKLHYVSRYVDMFSTAMHHKPWRSRRYLDLFAGPGKCRIRRTGEIIFGSPLIAITTDHPFTDYVFVDSSEEYITALRQRCESASVAANTIFVTDDANSAAQSIVEEIIESDAQYRPGQWWSLNLTFLDPEGLELEWETVATLAQVEKMDLIIHYSQNGLTRNLENCVDVDAETIVDTFFGDRKWRKIYGEQRERGASSGSIHRELMDHYKSRLTSLGYVEVVDHAYTAEPLIRNRIRNAPLYRLLFASKHELGHKFWSEVTRRDVYGQQRLL